GRRRHADRRRSGAGKLSSRSVHNQSASAMNITESSRRHERKDDMRLIVGALAAAGLFVAAPAVAQAQAGINVGMQVTDASGGPVGTVVGIQGANLLIGMTQAQLDSAVEQSLAAANAAIVAGASVKGLDGAAVGTIDSLADG